MNAWIGVRWGVVLCIVTIFYGFALGAIMGGNEQFFKSDFKQTVQTNATKVFGNDKAKMDRAEDRAWVYVKRSHMHAAGIGATGLALMAIIPLVVNSLKKQMLLSTALGIGGLGYSVCWILAGYKIPILGNSDAAKAAMEWLAVPSILLMVISIFIILLLLLKKALTVREV